MRSTLSVTDACEALRLALTEPPPKWWRWALGGPQHAFGRVRSGRVLVHLREPGQRASPVRLRARVVANGSGSVLRGTIGIGRGVRALLTVWLVGVGAFFVGGVTGLVVTGEPAYAPVVAVPAGLLVFFAGMVASGGLGAPRDVERLLDWVRDQWGVRDD